MMVAAAALPMAAQQSVLADSLRDSARNAGCDSIIAAARVDSVDAGIFLSVRRVDGLYLSDSAARLIVLTIGSAFVAPHPLRLSVFSGPQRMRMLRRSSPDTLPEPRQPSLTGIYRMSMVHGDSIGRVRTTRSSLMVAFDSAAHEAIRIASRVDGAFDTLEGDSLQLEVRFDSDSIAGAHRLVRAYFPRLRVSDAVPRPGNPPAPFPEEARRDSLAAGDVVFRFVVGRDGAPDLSTIELVRGGEIAFIRAAFAALPEQRFSPATAHGCAVAQVIEYPFIFQPDPVRLH
jgi:hypothetical protein